jgi:hypothetical protein
VGPQRGPESHQKLASINFLEIKAAELNLRFESVKPQPITNKDERSTLAASLNIGTVE